MQMMILLHIVGFTQQADFTDVIESFQFYKNSNLVEKIYAHIDRPVYVVGETMWFKLYCTEGSSNVPLAVSKVGYVEIIGDENEPILQTIVSLDDNGMGYGSLVLPAALRSGRYIFRAYTNWMKNFDPEFYFHEVVSIVNPFVAISSTVEGRTKEYDVQFFPEGGNMVYGITSKIAFRVVNQSGKGVEFSGVILDSTNDTISLFNPLKFGLGNFTFTPLKGSTYRAVIRFKGGEIRTYELPSPLEAGYTLQVKDTSQNMVSVKVFAKNVPENDVYLLAHANHLIKTLKTGYIKDGLSVFLLDKNQLGDGIIHLTVFNKFFSPICERLYFNGIGNRLNINVQTDKLEYKARENVALRIRVNDLHGEQLTANLSVSVYRIDSLVETEHQDITTYLKITSDLVGNIEEPDFYFSGENSNKHRLEIDNLMLTHGWRRFHWKGILENEYKLEKFKHIIELRGHLLKGVLSSTESGEPISGVHVYFSVPHMQQSAISKTNDHGEFLFDTRYYGKKMVTLQTDHSYRIELLTPFSKQFGSNYTFSELSLMSDLKNRLNARSIYSQVHNAFTKGTEQIQTPDHVLLPIFGQPEREYRLDDYTRFTTLEEVLREYVPEIAVRRNKGIYRQVVINPSTNLGFSNEPLILLDGTRVLDVNRFMSIDPLQIRTLQIVNKQYFFAGLSFDGLISYTTYNSDLGGYEIDKGIITEYKIFDAEREFFSPVYSIESTQTSRIPDTRTLLYWNPNVDVDLDGTKNLDFFASDLSGQFKIVIQGISENGLAGSSFTTFIVARIK